VHIYFYLLYLNRRVNFGHLSVYGMRVLNCGDVNYKNKKGGPFFKNF
jgi:hypothetical protein